jgi:hypothetical protein
VLGQQPGRHHERDPGLLKAALYGAPHGARSARVSATAPTRAARRACNSGR